MNIVSKIDDISPNLTLRGFKAELTCDECEASQIELIYVQSIDGDLSLIDVLDSALTENEWCDQLGVCPNCKEEFENSEAEERRAS